MKRYEPNTAIAAESVEPSLTLTAEQESQFVRAMKVGYYKEFYKQGLITAEQLEMLIAMQDKPLHEQVA